MLHKSSKPVILVVNKIDDISKVDDVHEFYALGIGDPLAISTAHGIGIGDLLDRIVKLLPDRKVKTYEDAICFSIQFNQCNS